MGPKRKRNERASMDNGDQRPSPHRPQNASMAQHDRGDLRDGGQRRSSRGGQGGAGGRGGRRNDGRDNHNKLNLSNNGRSTPTPGTPGPMSPPVRPSSAAPTPTQASAPSPEIPSSLPRPEPAFYCYEFLTEARLASWNTNGRAKVIAAGIQARQDEDSMDISNILQELTRAALDGHLDPGDAGSCVEQILGPQAYAEGAPFGAFDPHKMFLDLVSVNYEAEEGPVNPAFRLFMFATNVSGDLMRQTLDAKMLQDITLTRDTFIRVGVRRATNLLYRQANYNLLREETEGYSKLMTELFTVSGNEPPSKEVVEETFERVKALIGTFDLDVGRVLDVTLDVFASVLVKQYRFFVKLLRISSWWPRTGKLETSLRQGGLPRWALPSSTGWAPTVGDEVTAKQERFKRDLSFWDRAREIGLDAFFELGGTPIIGDEMKQRLLDARSSGDGNVEADREWVEITGTIPPSGNRVAAQLLGFKLRFYASEARDKEDALPPNLIFLTALLIKIGFISLRDLYPHIWPVDPDMPTLRDKKMKELAEKDRLARGGGDNALTRAGALSDDSVPVSRSKEAAKSEPAAKSAAEIEDKDKLDEPVEQKGQLLGCLLTIGAIPEAMFMLGKFPWLLEAFPDHIELINRILNHSIDLVYRNAEPVANVDTEYAAKKVADIDQSGMPKGQVRLTEIPGKKQLRWPFADKAETSEGFSYRFYWDDWNDNIPVCQTVDDLFILCNTFLNFAGPSIGKDVALLSKIARIGVKDLARSRTPENLSRWEDLLKRILVPALSITTGNTQVCNDVWELLMFYPTSVRYSIYGEWFQGATSRLAAVRTAFARTKAETQNTMKRISKNNIPAMARALSKTTFSSPGVVFEIALSQIESYTNLTEVVVECAKYFTDLGFDVLVWSLMVALGGKNRKRTNAEFALLPSPWLLALSNFSGKVYKRYSGMSLMPVLKYVSDQLYRGNSTDLVILKELIAQMAGVVPDTDYNNDQIIAMTGGEALRKHTLIDLQDKRFETTYIKSAKRLLHNLTHHKLAGELLISIAQHRQAAIYRISDEDAHIKLLATMIDDAQTILSQYLDFLRSNLSVEDFDEQVPGIPELMVEYGLEPQIAFMIGRISVAYHKIRSRVVSNGASKALDPPVEIPAAVDAEGDVQMDGEDSKAVSGDQIISDVSVVPVKEDSPMVDAKDESTPRSASASEPPQSPTELSSNNLDAIISAVKMVVPEATFNAFSHELYATFWTSSLSDLAVPQRSYDLQIERLMSQEKQLTAAAAATRGTTTRGKDTERKALSDTRETLFLEMKKLVGGASMRKTRLLKNKSSWFSATAKGDYISDMFLEKCLLPRLLLSPVDSEYCFRMVKFLHDNGVPYFRTLSLYSRFFRSNRLRTLIFTCSVREAENLGRFIRLALTDLARWHADPSLYQKEALGSSSQLPGFAKALNEDGKPKALLEHAGEPSFRSVLFNWHKNLNTAIRDCLEGTEWMHIRNAITILKSTVEVFPAVDFMGNGFVKQLEVIARREKGAREDLVLTATTVSVLLSKNDKKWVMVQMFNNNATAAAQTNGTQSIARPGQSSASKSGLKPTAPEFKPQSRASPASIATPKAQHSLEVEDGEVDDAKLSAAASTTAAVIPDVPRMAVEPKKSEILDRRDQIKRENAAKASAPMSSNASIPPKPESARGPLATSSLPTRPDGPFPSRDLIDSRPPRHADRRDGRDSRNTERGIDRSSNRPGDRRDFTGPDRRPPEAPNRDFNSRTERGPGSDRDRTRPEPPPRWTADSSRDNHDNRPNGSRMSNDGGRLSREMPPPRPSSERLNNVDKSGITNVDRQELINPDRVALISGDKDASRAESPRRSREDTRDKGSRPQSPRRHGSEKDSFDSRRDDRSTRNGPVENRASSRSQPEEFQPPPAGPRGDRAGDRERGGANDRSFQPVQAMPRSIDPDHGRLNAPPRQQPDPNFGRLNSIPSSDIPSGPRDRQSRGNRPPANTSTPTPRGRGPMDMPRPPTPDRQPPTGPGGGRHGRHSTSGQFEPITTTGLSAPAAPVIASPAAGIHPDRLKALGVSVPQPAQSQSLTTPAATPPIHPDRARSMNQDSPVPPHQQRHMNNERPRPNVTPVVTATPPSGPKGAQASPTTPSSSFGAPTGPASASERTARGGRRQLLDGINTILDPGGQQRPDRMNSRGRAGRMGPNGGHDSPSSVQSHASIAPPPAPPVQPPARDVGRELINPARADLISNSAPVDERDRDRTGRRLHSGRHSRRSSRSPARDSKRGPEDERSRNENRERSDRPRGDRGELDKDRHQNSAPGPKDFNSGRDGNVSRDAPGGRDSMGGRDSTGGRDQTGGRDRERGSDGHRDRDSGRRESGRDARDRDASHANTRDGHESGWGGGRGGRLRGRDSRGDMGGEDRHGDSRGTRDDSSRKRHTGEEGMDPRGRDPKRPRR